MTEDQQRALASMSLRVVEFDAEKLQEKRDMAAEIVRMGHVSADIMRKAALVYVGSHLDIELSLLLGGRNIELVDPCFANHMNIVALEKRIEREMHKKVRPSLADLKFDFDFGAGEEEVTVRCRPYVYRPTAETESTPSPWKRQALTEMQREYQHIYETHSNVPTYEPLGDIGMLVGYSAVGVSFDQNQAVMDRLVVGGYVLNYPGPYEGLNVTAEEFWTLHKVPRFMWTALVMSRYRFETNYSFIPLGCAPDDLYYSFIRKEYHDKED